MESGVRNTEYEKVLGDDFSEAFDFRLGDEERLFRRPYIIYPEDSFKHIWDLLITV